MPDYSTKDRERAKPEMGLTFSHILALVRAMPEYGSDVLPLDALRLQGIAVLWFAALQKVDVHTCAVCGSHWSTSEKRDICTHVTPMGESIPEQADKYEQKTIRNWMEQARHA